MAEQSESKYSPEEVEHITNNFNDLKTRLKKQVFQEDLESFVNGIEGEEG